MIEFKGTSNRNKKYYWCHFKTKEELINFILTENLSRSSNRRSITDQINKAIKNGTKYLGMECLICD